MLGVSGTSAQSLNSWKNAHQFSMIRSAALPMHTSQNVCCEIPAQTTSTTLFDSCKHGGSALNSLLTNAVLGRVACDSDIIVQGVEWSQGLTNIWHYASRLRGSY